MSRPKEKNRIDYCFSKFCILKKNNFFDCLNYYKFRWLFVILSVFQKYSLSFFFYKSLKLIPFVDNFYQFRSFATDFIFYFVRYDFCVCLYIMTFCQLSSFNVGFQITIIVMKLISFLVTCLYIYFYFILTCIMFSKFYILMTIYFFFFFVN